MGHDLESMLGMRAGHLLLESGHHGELWLELDLLFSDPGRVDPLAGELAELLRPHGVEVVCGPLTGGALLAQLVAARLGAALAWTEKRSAAPSTGLYTAQYRIPQVQRTLLLDRRVAVIDDVINAGSAVRATVDDVRAAGGRVAAIGALLVLGDRAASYADELGVPLERLGCRDSPIWAPADCPLCARSVPLENLLSGTG